MVGSITTMEELQNFITANKGRESRIVEFKEWSKFPDMNSPNNPRNLYWYCVGIGNEWGGFLLIWVNNNGEIIGTSAELPSNIEKNIFDKTKQKITIEALIIDKSKKVFIVQIPPRKNWELLKWNWVPLMRIWDSLSVMDDITMRGILNEGILTDWSKDLCKDANIDDLDPLAITKARENYKVKHPNLVEEIDSWDDKTFLNKARLTIKNEITKTAILLLWKPESSHFLSPSTWWITWTLFDEKWENLDYEHFWLPLLLSIDSVFWKIRNLKYRYIREGSDSLFPEEVSKYEPYIIREALNNCIAHQDYTLGGRIMVIERPDSLTFENLWSFLPQSIEKVVIENSPELHYRNRYLTDAMENLNMIDTVWRGIRTMFNLQQKKFFPLPDYDLSNSKVKVTITGKVLDMNYARQLAQFKDLSLFEIMMLDKIQKNKNLTKVEYQHLKSKKLIEWTMRNHYISAMLAEKTDQRSNYIKQKGITDIHCQQLIIECLTTWGNNGITRKEFEDILLEKLWDGMTLKQKKDKIKNNLQKLRRDRKIFVKESRKWFKI